MQIVSPINAVSCIRSEDRVFVHTAVASPQVLIDAMVERAPELRDVEIVHLHTESNAANCDPAYKDSFRVVSLFIGPNVRKVTNSSHQDNVDYIPVFLSEVPMLFRRRLLPNDVVIAHPDLRDQLAHQYYN